MPTNRAHLTIDAWDRAAKADTYAAAIHPSGDAGTDSTQWRDSGMEHASHWTSAWWHHADYAEPATILDFGCGAGRVTLPLVELWPRSQIIAADASRTMLVRLHHASLPGRHNANITPLLSDGFDGRLPEGLDAVHSIIVLQHYLWEDGAELLRRLVRAVRPGGLLGIQLPLYAIEGQSSDWTGVTTWTVHRFAEVAQQAGAAILEARVSPSLFRPGAVGPHHGAYHWLRRL
jgi:SAM-dependent methyltransferase